MRAGFLITVRGWGFAVSFPVGLASGLLPQPLVIKEPENLLAHTEMVELQRIRQTVFFYLFPAASL